MSGARGVVAIAALEVSRRWMIYVLAIVLGVIPVVCWQQERGDLAETSFFASVVIVWVAAFLTGMGSVGRPLHDGRLAFLFARPVSGAAIALGKVVGGLVLTLVATVLVLVPPYLGAGWVVDDRIAVVFATSIGCVFFAAGLVVGILSRSRTRWFLLDAGGATVVALLVLAVLGRIAQVGEWMVRAEYSPEQAAPVFARQSAILVGAAVAAVLVVLGAVTVAIARGRTDRERVHRVLSLALWPSLAVVGVIGLALAIWLDVSIVGAA